MSSVSSDEELCQLTDEELHQRAQDGRLSWDRFCNFMFSRHQQQLLKCAKRTFPNDADTVLNEVFRRLLELGLKFKLTVTSLVALRAAQVPAAVLSKLGVMKDRGFLTQGDFIHQLKSALSEHEFELYQSVIIHCAKKRDE